MLYLFVYFHWAIPETVRLKSEKWNNVIVFTAAVYVPSQFAYTAANHKDIRTAMLFMFVIKYSTYSVLYRLVGRKQSVHNRYGSE